MRVYELVVVINPSVPAEKRKKLVETVKTWLQDVKVSKEEEWGQKVLSYPIKKELSGFFTLLTLETAGVIPADLEKRILGNDSILRHLLIRRK